jgi:hypothetical protein
MLSDKLIDKLADVVKEIEQEGYLVSFNIGKPPEKIANNQYATDMIVYQPPNAVFIDLCLKNMVNRLHAHLAKNN